VCDVNAKIAVLAGDGVGREIVPEAVKVASGFCISLFCLHFTQ